MTEKKYLDKMEWQPEVIYYVKAFSRNPDFPPKVWENEGKFGPFYVTDIKVARYNTIDKQYTEIGNYQFRIAKSILREVTHRVDVDMPFYLRKSAGFSKDGKPITKYNIYNTPEEITNIQQDMISEKEIQPEPEIPFDDYRGDDEVAFKEDIKKESTIPKGELKVPEGVLKEWKEMMPKDLSLEILATLQGIEENLRLIANCFKEMLDKFTVKIKKVDE